MAKAPFHELSIENIPEYVESQPAIRSRVGGVRRVVQSGEGKINGVFFVDGSIGSVVLKQGLPWVRTLPDWELTVDRIGFEATLLKTWSGFNSGFIPELWQYDELAHVLAMENLSGHALLRDVLATSAGMEELGDNLGKLLARTAYFTSTLSMPLSDHSEAVRTGQNPEMSQLMEDVVFNIPFSENESNVRDPVLSAHRARLISNDKVYQTVSRLKWISATRQEALLHGDLHTGSIMVQESDVRIIDAEFGRYGPIASDIGQLWAHIFIAARVHSVRISPDLASETFGIIERSWGSFCSEIRQLTTSKSGPAGVSAWISSWLAETRTLAIQFAGVETLRRIIGVGDCEQLGGLPEDWKMAAIDSLVGGATAAIVDGRWSVGDTPSTIHE